MGEVETAQFLLAHGADINARDKPGRTPLDNAVLSLLFVPEAKKTYRLVPTPEQRDAAIRLPADRGGAMGLDSAVAAGRVDLAEELLAKGVDVNTPYRAGRTALHTAVDYIELDMIHFLIAHGADINARDNNGQTPLGKAEEVGHREIAALLRKHGGKTGRELGRESDCQP